MGLYSEAEQLLHKASNIFRKQLGEGHVDYTTTQNNLAILYVKTGRFKEAETLFESVIINDQNNLGKNHPYYATCLSRLAFLYKKMENFEEAAQYYIESTEKTLLLNDRYFPALSEREKMIYWTTVSNRIEKFNSFAVKYYTQNPEILKYMYDYRLSTKGIILESMKKTLKKARTTGTILKKWQTTREYWMKLVQNPMKAKQMGVDIDSVAKAANEYEKMLSSQSLDFKRAYDTTKVRWQDVQYSLKENEAAIEIIRFDYFDDEWTDNVCYAALIITGQQNSGVELILLENGKELESFYIKQYSKLIKTHKNEGNDILKGLYTKYWQKVGDKLQGIKTVYISLDGVYNKINLNTLLNPETGAYLIDEININIVTSTKDLTEKNKDNSYSSGLMANDNSAVLFGNPKFKLEKKEAIPIASGATESGMDPQRALIVEIDRSNFQALPGTKKEIKKISIELQNSNWMTKVFLGADALEDNIKTLESPKVLHIATHGIFMEDMKKLKSTFGIEKNRYIENPLLRSMLLLAGSSNTNESALNRSATPAADILSGDIWAEDGILTAYEIKNLNLDNTELVVLSACETGLGDIKNGEGVYGLQRAFQQAGARTIIMSLWTVDDNTTQQLMTKFYKKWLSGQTKRQAFIEAQQELKKKYKHPYYWGAFVMVGE